jgi:hypothetical protein
MIASSGAPYNVVLSQDFIGSTVFNQRPALATSPVNPAYVVNTPLGNFDTNVTDLGQGESIIPVNAFTGPPHFSLNLRLSKVFGFGKIPEAAGANGGGGGGHDHGPGGPGGGRGPGGPFGGGMGGMGGGGGTNRRYNLTLSVNARNITNYLNVVQPSGVLNVPDPSSPSPYELSPFFGKSNGLAAGPFSSNGASRLFYLQVGFTF